MTQTATPASRTGGRDLGAPEYLIVGGGFSGIGMGIALDRAGLRDWLLVEQGDDVGGTWFWNTYPGIGVDIPSFSYQYGFERRTTWSRVYAPGEELAEYARDVTAKYGLRDRMRFGVRVLGAAFDEAADRWEVETTAGVCRPRFLVSASGVLTQPKYPAIEGLSDFAGPCFHTARWEHDVDLRGKRVGIIGTGASAVQVVPAIAEEVEQLVVFQRTPIWCLPRPDGPISPAAQRALRWVPGLDLMVRGASQAFVELTFPLAAQFGGPIIDRFGGTGRRHLQRQVKDPVVREQLTPKYAVGCKRPSFSNTYLKTFNRENVVLETRPIERVTAGGVVVGAGDAGGGVGAAGAAGGGAAGAAGGAGAAGSAAGGADGVGVAAGAEHELDVLILATGFLVMEQGNVPPFPIRSGSGADLGEFWERERFQAYEGVTIPGFPNLFSVFGPWGYNGSSYFNLIDTSTTHITRVLKEAHRRGASRVEVSQDAHDAYMRRMWAGRKLSVFNDPSCANANSYYFDQHGDTPFRPSTSLGVWWRSRRLPMSDYVFAGR
jgi:cation diffusion facilitator CzcD-associated flavoprotein CzcO